MFFFSFTLGVQSPFVAGLTAYTQFYCQCTFSSSTVKTYGSYFRAFDRFCALLGIALVPASTSALCMYAALLARFLLPQSVCLYVNFVGLIYKGHGLPNPLVSNSLISSIISGIHRVYDTPVKTRPLITMEILLGIRFHLNLLNSRHALFWAIFLVSFFGLFRKAHLLPVSDSRFNPAQQFTRSDFSITEYRYSVLERWRKTTQLGHRTITVPLIRLSNSPLCPFQAVIHAFTLTPVTRPNSQAFCYQEQHGIISVFTYNSFITLLKTILSELGLDPHNYGTFLSSRGILICPRGESFIRHYLPYGRLKIGLHISLSPYVFDTTFVC